MEVSSNNLPISDPDVQQFITNQTAMNNTIEKVTETNLQNKTARDQQQENTLKLLKDLTEKNEDAPLAKEWRPDTNKDSLTSNMGTKPNKNSLISLSSGKQKASTSAAKAILTSPIPGLHDVLNLDTRAVSLTDKELALLNQLNDPDPEGDKENHPILDETKQQIDSQNSLVMNRETWRRLRRY